MKTIILEKSAFDDIKWWAENDLKAVKKIVNLINDISKNPFSGVGKPEPLKYDLSGYWSRRITEEHRLVYKSDGEVITIISCRFHYV